MPLRQRQVHGTNLRIQMRADSNLTHVTRVNLDIIPGFTILSNPAQLTTFPCLNLFNSSEVDAIERRIQNVTNSCESIPLNSSKMKEK